MNKLAFLIIFLLTGCATNPDLLSKKQECFSYKKALEESKNTSFSMKGLSTSTTVNRVFYSSKENSCLYVLQTSSMHTDEPGANGFTDTFEIYDHLEGVKLYSVKGCDGELYCGLSAEEAESEFTEELEKYN
jgi:hypothetical protein